MTLAVVDASVALKLFLAEEGSVEAEALHRSRELIAPDLVLPEILNALWKALRRDLVQAEQAQQVAAAVTQPFFAFVAAEDLYERAWTIALELDHPMYDAFYIALAERERCTLFTADERLCRKTQRTRFERLVKPLRAMRGSAPGKA